MEKSYLHFNIKINKTNSIVRTIVGLIILVFCFISFKSSHSLELQEKNNTLNLKGDNDSQAQDIRTLQEFNVQNANQIYFRENKGQVKDQYWQARTDVLFSGEQAGLVFHLKSTGLHYQLAQVESWMENEVAFIQRGLQEQENQKIPDKIGIYRVDVSWLNANPNAEIIKGEELSGYNNYYNVPEGVEPALNVKSYTSVLYKNIYPGIDLHFYEGPHKGLEYDFIVQAGADYSQIEIEVKGAELFVNEYNELILKTPFGEIIEGALKVYQGDTEIESSWQLEDNRISFAINEYDPLLPIRIDPPVRVWGTYYGGEGIDVNNSVTTDINNNIYIAGNTRSSFNIATTGAHQDSIPGTPFTAYLIKFNENGDRQWGTYYGGDKLDVGYSCVTDENENVYLAGLTLSSNNISTTGAHQESFAGNSNAFLVKFNSNGIRQWGTYYGGDSYDNGYSCATDAFGNIYISGRTFSTNNIATVSSHQSSLGGKSDAFLVKFNSNGERQWGTYYGGYDDEEGYSCETDNNGNVFLAGETKSSNNIATIGAHQSNFSGESDAFLVKFNSNGERQWGTYYGGDSFDNGYSCATDVFGNVFMAGLTYSENNISTPGAHHETRWATASDAFLVKFNSKGERQWGTYYGATHNPDWHYTFGSSCITDIYGNVYLAGETEAIDDIATSGTHQENFGGKYEIGDAFLVKFDSNGSRQWGTYYGGKEDELVISCAIDAKGNVYLAGSTQSSDKIATNGAHQEEIAGYIDPFLVKFKADDDSYNLKDISSKMHFKLFPNPNDGNFTLMWDNNNRNTKVTIFDILGQIVFESIVTGNEHNISLDVPKGIYLIRLNLDEETAVLKMIKE